MRPLLKPVSPARRLVLLTSAAAAALTCAPACSLGPRHPIETVPLPDNQRPGENGTPNDPTDGACCAGGVAPEINTSAIFWAEAEPLTVLLVGVTGALPSAGRLLIANPARSQSAEAIDVSSDGSFARPVYAAIGDVLELDFEVAGVAVHTTMLTLVDGSVNAFAANADLDVAGSPPTSGGGAENPDEVRADESEGMVTVSALAGSLSPGISIVVANMTRNLAAFGRVESDGSFSVRIAGQSGDALRVFAVEPAASNGSGAPLELVVP